MKVLQINSVCGVRSTGRICTDIADVLNEFGDQCKIAYGRCEVPERYKEISIKIGSDFSLAFLGIVMYPVAALGPGAGMLTA